MLVTIIADGSYCPNTKKAGYAFWIASKRGKLGGDGVLKGKIENNIVTEMMALLNGLYVAYKTNLILKGDAVLLQTDCEPAITGFTLSRKVRGTREQELIAYFNKFATKYNLKIRFKHVKGHTRRTESRYVVNNICDHKARENMRRARDIYIKSKEVK